MFVPGVCRGQETSDPLKLEFQMVGVTLWVLGAKQGLLQEQVLLTLEPSPEP